MTERETLKLALEAFEEIAWSNSTDWQRDRAKVAITAIKEVLAQPKQEPVAQPDSVGYVYSVHGERIKNACIRSDIPNGTPLYTTPPQRTWVGLTDEDKQTAFDETQEGGGFWEFADAIEAKLKEKNT